MGIGVGFQIMNPDKDGLGEIACRSRNIFMGYHKDEAKTKETFTEDNWMLSGDLGKLDDDGFLEIKGRLKEIIITSGGKNVAPVPIEEEIKKELEGLISYAIAVGDNRKFLTCLLTLQVEPDPATMQPTDKLTRSVRSWSGRIIGKKAASKLITVQDFLTCPQYPELRDAVQKAILRANSRASSPVAMVKAFQFLPKEPAVKTGELSPTLKVKRFYLNQKHADLIDEMYDTGKEEVKDVSDEKTQAAATARQAQ